VSNRTARRGLRRAKHHIDGVPTAFATTPLDKKLVVRSSSGTGTPTVALTICAEERVGIRPWFVRRRHFWRRQCRVAARKEGRHGGIGGILYDVFVKPREIVRYLVAGDVDTALMSRAGRADRVIVSSKDGGTGNNYLSNSRYMVGNCPYAQLSMLSLEFFQST